MKPSCLYQRRGTLPMGVSTDLVAICGRGAERKLGGSAEAPAPQIQAETVMRQERGSSSRNSRP
jgi:hypothetical protein